MLGELVEEGVFAVVGGPKGDVEAPGDAALGGLPKEPCVGVFGKLVEADVAPVNGHGLRVSREGDDAGAIIEFDGADFDFVGESGGAAFVVEARDFEVLFTVGNDGAGEVEEVGEFVDLVHVFESAGPVFGGEEVIAFVEAEPFTDVFESVGVGPADANGFFGQGIGLFVLGVDGVLALDPVELVGHEVAGEFGVGIDTGMGKNGAHGRGILIFDF